MTRWYEDIFPGMQFELGDHTFDEAEIRRFGAAYDPQYFHTDPEAAGKSHFGGLIASGWHTACVGHRIMVDRLFAEADRIRAEGKEPGIAGPSPGINAMIFKTPVRPGDTVTYTLTVSDKRLSKSLPGWGILTNRIEAHNQRSELVYRADVISFSRLRDYRPSLKHRLFLAMLQIPVLGPRLRRR